MTTPREDFMTKPVDEMTMDEILEERAKIAAERAALGGLQPETVVELPEAPAEEVTEDTTPKWPHDFLEYQGMTLEVRKPGEAALVAISLTGSPSLTGDVQMRIFSKFLENHMSPKTFGEVIEAMLDPDSEINLQGLIKALAEMKR